MTKESGSAIYRLKQQGKNLFGLCPQGGPSEKEFCRMKEKKIMLPTVEIAKKFVAEAKEKGLVNLNGHRSIGGMRASIYNAMPEEGVDRLIEFMEEFRKANQ